MTNQKITYTFPVDFPLPAVAGKTFSGGVPGYHVIDKKQEKVVRFETKLDGRDVVVKLEGKPDLQVLVDDYQAQIDLDKKTKQEQLNLAVPGIHELKVAQDAYIYDRDRYQSSFQKMMEDEQTTAQIHQNQRIPVSCWNMRGCVINTHEHHFT
jgi:hypothetical protein